MVNETVIGLNKIENMNINDNKSKLKISLDDKIGFEIRNLLQFNFYGFS